MRYDYSAHMSLNESIRQIGSREHDISIIQSIIEDIFSRADALLESEEFFIEFYADNKAKLNTLLTESVLTEEQFLSYVTPIIVEGIFSSIWGERLGNIRKDIGGQLSGIQRLSDMGKKKEGQTDDFYDKAERFRVRNFDRLKSEYEQRSGKGILGFARKLRSRFSGEDNSEFDSSKLMGSLSSEEKREAINREGNKRIRAAGEKAVQSTTFDKQPGFDMKGRGAVKGYKRKITAGGQYLDLLRKKDPNRLKEIGAKADQRTEEDLIADKMLGTREREAQNRRIDLQREYNRAKKKLG